MPTQRKLTASEESVLLVLAEGRVTPGVTRLASDLYQRGKDKRFTFGDPVGFVTWLLEGLAESGHVKYKLPATGDESAPAGYHGLPYSIRLTPKGWAACGYEHTHGEVGRSPRLREVNPAEATDYRNQPSSAEYTTIERLPWWEHRAKYPDHTHGYELFEEGEDVALMATRQYVKVTPDMEERVMAAYARLDDYAKTAAETNVTERQVRYIVKDRPVLKRDTGSLKVRVLNMVRERGPYPDVSSLHADLPGPHGLHNLVHVLHSLHKAELIDFKEDRSGGNGVNYLRIRAVLPTAEADFSGLAEADEVLAEVVEASDTQPVTAVALTEPVGPTYPELARLRELSAQAERDKVKAAQYLAAAEVLADADPETAELLLTKATEVPHTGLSPVEREYLTYVEAHERGQQDG